MVTEADKRRALSQLFSGDQTFVEIGPVSPDYLQPRIVYECFCGHRLTDARRVEMERRKIGRVGYGWAYPFVGQCPNCRKVYHAWEKQVTPPAIYNSPEYRQLLEPILDFPDDDLARLVMADWLEEKGEAERTELIRVQIELANNPNGSDTPQPRHITPTSLYLKLRRREEEILNPRPSHRSTAAWLGEESLCKMAWDTASWKWLRGFVGEVTCSQTDWIAAGVAIAETQPVEAIYFLGPPPAWAKIPWCRGHGLDSPDNEPCRCLEGRAALAWAKTGARHLRRLARS